MSTETAPDPEETKEKKQQPQCGRLVFRGVELAYLNIDGEFLLPLAELLALILPSTPRTTLFTRMEKMKVRRHFCDPDEIKLLKTVNGIHGSSANCTLLSKTEVEKYCSIYIDKPNESNQMSAGEENSARVGRESNQGENGRKEKENTETTHQNNNAIPNKLAVLDKHKKSTPLKRRLKLTKVATRKKLKLRSAPDCQVNKTLTDNTNRAAIDGDLTSGNVNECGEGCLFVSPSSSHLVKNSTQTQGLENLVANKKRAKKRDSSAVNKTMRKVTPGKKRLANDLDKRKAFGSPLKIPKRSELNGQEESDKIKGTSCTSKKKDFDAIISDSSSNDSGFVSTSLSNASTPTKTDFSAGELSGLLKKDGEGTNSIKKHSSPGTLKVKTPKKNKAEEDYGKSLTLSPPALLLKRFEDSWLVEQKSPVNAELEVTKCLQIKGKEKIKPRKKASLTPLFEEVCGPAKPLFEQKQAKKEKKFRKPQSLKEEIGSREPLITNDLIVGERQDVKRFKEKTKRKQRKPLKLKPRREQGLFNGQVLSPSKNADFSTTKEKKLESLPRETASPIGKPGAYEQTQEELLKKDKVLERLVGDAIAKFFAPTSLESAPSPDKVDKPKPKKAKIAGVTKPVLKINSSFTLLNLFPVMSPLTLQDGGLSPMFTMSCPKGVQPDSSHALWKWHIGGPVVSCTPTLLKPTTVQKKPLSTANLIANKVRKLKRKRKKPSTNKKPLCSASVSNGVANVPPSDSAKESDPNATETEIHVLPCDKAPDIASSLAGVKVS